MGSVTKRIRTNIKSAALTRLTGERKCARKVAHQIKIDPSVRAARPGKAGA